MLLAIDIGNTNPSIMAAVPYIMPLRMQSTVFLPMTFLGLSREIPGS